MTAAELQAIRDRMCTGKRTMGAARARETASALQHRTGENVHPYRCVFCRAWHVGHSPDMRTVALIAEAIRYRSYPQPVHDDKAEAS